MSSDTLGCLSDVGDIRLGLCRLVQKYGQEKKEKKELLQQQLFVPRSSSRTSHTAGCSREVPSGPRKL